MNIFVTNTNPTLCAFEHCNVHMRKMIIESAQLLASAHHHFGVAKPGMYKATHINHPCAIWVRECADNYYWVADLLKALLAMYKSNTGKMHATAKQYIFLKDIPKGLSAKLGDRLMERDQMTFVQCMPDEFKHDDPTIAYQNYLNHKFADWQARERPIKVEFHFPKPEWVTL